MTSHEDAAMIRKSRTRTALSFVLHQLLSTLVVMPLAAFLTFAAAPLFRPFLASPLNVHQVSAALTETPGFPIQVVLGFIVGATLGCWLKQKPAQWVWLLPVTVLAILFFTLPVSTLEHSSFFERIHYFFGTGCQPSQRCFDQIVTTGPTLAAVSYSLGSFLGMRLRPKRSQFAG